jgi:hypothetical protein
MLDVCAKNAMANAQCATRLFDQLRSVAFVTNAHLGIRQGNAFYVELLVFLMPFIVMLVRDLKKIEMAVPIYLMSAAVKLIYGTRGEKTGHRYEEVRISCFTFKYF